ncbi:MAG: TlpA disulfide reductase family protein [Aromatoleum sp.]|uniref:TlpA family protein disulfide reductase n=1 Tax=Aromatoleum sp. TaxID=2307007 RepID=UPI00289546D8|nr:TlpA disulfide reductase family protein [Aromatoleum sp.]MDT3670054.1 TlpA disulfide reductase family protein [Aromatoleum sp.]
MPALSRGPGSLPAVALTKLDGTPMRATDWLGRPLVVNIWATWCPPCRTEMPSLQRLSALIDPSGARVVALSLDTDPNLVREFVLKYGIELPVAIAMSPGAATEALGATALPLTLYVAADGRIVGRHFGQRDWAEESAVRDVRQRLLAR